jgi:N-acetylmuramoyl-L-alanine amidase
MPQDYEVEQGDCISSIAYDNGFFWETIWNHPNNADLKNLRKDANALLPGDVVYIPDLEQNEVPGATEQQHKFRLKGVPAGLIIRLMDPDGPRAGLSYKLIIDGIVTSGQTDANGTITASISPSAREGTLIVGDEGEEYDLDLGYIDPVEEICGMQERLANLGFYSGDSTGVNDEDTQNAIKAFQLAYNLTQSGDPDASTQAKLKDVYGC